MIHARWELFLIGWAVAAAIQLALYLVQRRTGDATAVDAGWAASLAAIAVLYGVFADGSGVHRALITAIAGLENLKLALLVARRVGKGEDLRYRELRERWRARGAEQQRFFVFFQAQALLAAILSAPFLFAAFDPDTSLGVLALVGAVVWLAAAVLEGVADEQLRRFKDDDANRGKTMTAGLWRYSRHPNYFFQWLTWVAYGLVAREAPYGWIGLSAPVLMLLLIVFVTGLPPAEASSLRSRGDEYRRYQRRTSAFVPWFPKTGGA